MIEVKEAPASVTGWGAARLPAPTDVREAVELWAREFRGTHGTIVWNIVMKCWEVRLDLKSDDPRLKRWQDGTLKVKPCEPVYLHRQARNDDGSVCSPPRWEGVSLEELGIGGVLDWLNQGNTMSGTGRFKSFNAACKAADQHNEDLKAKIAKVAEENAGLRARDNRKEILRTPWTTVPANITQEK